MKNSKSIAIIFSFFCALIFLLPGCKKDDIIDTPYSDYSNRTSDLTVSFTAASGPSSQEGSFSYSWNFGDGQTSTEKNPTHTFPYAGIFNVKLSVDNSGTTANYSYTVTVPKATMSMMNNGLAGTNITSLALSGSNLFAGTDSFGVFLSNDNGGLWIAIDSGFPLINNSVHSLVVNGTDVFAGTNSGIYKLTMAADTFWTQVGLIGKTVRSLNTSGSNIIAGTNTGIYLSSDNGNTWAQKLSRNITSMSGTGTTFVSSTGSSVYLSTDGGNAWVKVTDPASSGNPIQAAGVVGSDIFADAGLYYVDPTTKQITYYNADFLSKDNGVTWNPYSDVAVPGSGISNQIVNSFTTIGSRIYAATAYGIYVSTNGGDTRMALMALQGINTKSILVVGKDIYAATNKGVFVGTF